MSFLKPSQLLPEIAKYWTKKTNNQLHTKAEKDFYIKMNWKHIAQLLLDGANWSLSILQLDELLSVIAKFMAKSVETAHGNNYTFK